MDVDMYVMVFSGKKKPDSTTLVSYCILAPLVLAHENNKDIKKIFPELPFVKVVEALETGVSSQMNAALGQWLRAHVSAAAKFAASDMKEHARYPPPPAVNEKTPISADMEILTRC